jgi:hypothetical protein
MKNENLIYIQFENEKSIKTKKNILQTEITILEIIKKIEKYKYLRKNELKTKIKLLGKIRGINSNIKKIMIALPKIPSSKIKIKNQTKIIKKDIKYDKEIENELIEIRNKLKILQGINQ